MLLSNQRRSSATSLLDLKNNFFKSAKVMHHHLQPLDVTLIAKVKLIKNFGFSFPLSADEFWLFSSHASSKANSSSKTIAFSLFCLGVWPWWDDCGRKVCPICQPLWRQTIQGSSNFPFSFEVQLLVLPFTWFSGSLTSPHGTANLQKGVMGAESTCVPSSNLYPWAQIFVHLYQQLLTSISGK